MNCSISGVVPTQPVVCTKSGHVYEKSLIEKHVQATGRDPVTNVEITLEDLLPISSNTAVPPRPPSATSLPGMLKSFQGEWDAVMLETFKLKQTLDTTRQQLSHALYQHDAACRVIARLTKERDEARAALSNAKVVLDSRGLSLGDAAAGSAGAGAGAGAGVTAAVVAQWTDVSKTLSKGRKKRKAPEELAPEATVASFAHGELHSFHRKDKAGVTSVHAHDSAPSLIVTGGVDHTVKVFDLAATRVVDTLAGHSKRITRALWHPDITAGSRIVSASKDGDVRLWSKGGEGAYETAGTMTPHGGSEVMALEVHPSSDYLLTAAGGGAAGWSVTNAATGTVLGTFGADGPANTAASLHPDGLLYAVAGQDAGLRIFDLRSQAQVAAFEDATVAQNTLDFNENGRYMAGAGKDGQVGIWDLRKMGKVATMTAPGAVGAVAWDFSGSYLAAGSEDGGKGVVSVFKVKSWEQLLSTTAHAAAVTSLHWAPLATSLVSASMDNTVAKWGAAK